MAKKGNRVKIKMQSTESSHFYHTTKNKQKTPARLELKKYDPVIRKHVNFKETR